jgi:sulfur carrier protein
MTSSHVISPNDAEPRITITVNGAARSVPSGLSIERLLVEQGLAGKRGLAVAVNDAVVPRNNWAAQRLSEGSQVLIIQATQGG